jgi:metal-responsive CopG/Arc/MetJ family transcriptional regulator
MNTQKQHEVHSIMIDKDTLNRLDHYRAKIKLSRSSAIREILNRFLIKEAKEHE